jgi:hypothetical protein
MTSFVRDASVTRLEYTDSVYPCQEENTNFVKQPKKKNPVWVEVGSKLWKFQQDLELTQKALGERFSTNREDEWSRSFTTRTIQGYESGENEISGELLYNIHKAGYSVDAIFDDMAQDLDKQTARNLLGHGIIYDRQKDYRGAENSMPQKTPKSETTRPGAPATSGTRKHKNGKASKIGKQR